MLNSTLPVWLLGGWFAAAAAAVVSSVGMDARLSTTALLLGVGLAPAVVMLLIGANSSSPTVAEVLHSVSAGDRRS